MLPNYRLFCTLNSFADSRIMDNLLHALWSWVIDPQSTINIDAKLDKLEQITPDTQHFDNFGVLPALNCAVSMNALLQLLSQDDQQGAVVVCKLSQGTVEAYIDVTEPHIANSPQRNELLKQHPLMQWEIATQRELLAHINTHDRSKQASMPYGNWPYKKGSATLVLKIRNNSDRPERPQRNV